jgi:hypothetical protein
VPDVLAGRQRGVGSGPAVLRLHPPQSSGGGNRRLPGSADTP